MNCLMGIDIGTSSVKVAIFTQEGHLRSIAAEEYNFEVPVIGYSEHSPENWWKSTARTIKQAIKKADVLPQQIVSVGLSGQMHGMVALDDKNNVVRKAILHNDVRSAKQAQQAKNLLGESFTKITYNPLFPGFQLVSLLWTRENQPEIYEKIKTIICPKDYIRYRLTGEIGVEATDASGTLFYDMKNQTWATEMLNKLDINSEILPNIINNPYDIAGGVTKKAAEKTGLVAGTTVVFGGGDQAMHSLGNGVHKKGVMTATIGTGGQVLCITDSLKYNDQMNTHTMRHVEQDSWYGLGAMLNAGANLNWFSREILRERDYKKLDEEALQIPVCSEGLVYFPCMMGERTPYMDPDTRGMFIGLSSGHGRGHMVRAIMEGATFAMKDSIEILQTIYPGTQKIICAGGGAKSKLWLQIQADIYGREVYVSRTPEQACTGAAIVAGVGAGVFENIAEGCQRLVHISSDPISPVAENIEKYADFHSNVYKKLYKNNKELFDELKKY